MRNYFSMKDILNAAKDIHSLFDAQLLESPKYKCNLLIHVEYLLKGADNTILEKSLQ